MDALIFVGLLIASYTDLRYREIPLWIFPGIAGIYIINVMAQRVSFTTANIVGMVIMFFPTFVLCLFGKMGGGDVIMLSVIGLVLGVYQLLNFACCLGVAGTILLLKTGCNKRVPIAPLVLGAYVLYLFAC